VRRVGHLEFLLLGFLLWSASLSAAEIPQGAQEREYAASSATVKAALEQLGAYRGSRLPTLEGFIQTERVQLDQYQRPYYEFKVDLVPSASDQTLVRVKANVSAWYADPKGAQSAYHSFESNGRLESDLLDRLSEYLNKHKATSADADSLTKQIAAVRQQRLEVERHISELEKQTQPQPPPTPNSSTQYVSLSKPRNPIFSAPDEHSSVLLRGQSEDEFEVLERRGAWVRLGLGDNRSGWLKSSQILSKGPNSTIASGVLGEATAFTVIREVSSTFSGDWARLKGRKVLYIWARPEGSSLNVKTGAKLRFAQATFSERYRQAAHGSQVSLEGIVVIFLDQQGGVAAATFPDIGLWVEGAITEPAFLSRCSLDPSSAFVGASRPSDARRMNPEAPPRSRMMRGLTCQRGRI
jgi:hypothetical protein